MVCFYLILDTVFFVSVCITLVEINLPINQVNGDKIKNKKHTMKYIIWAVYLGEVKLKLNLHHNKYYIQKEHKKTLSGMFTFNVSQIAQYLPSSFVDVSGMATSKFVDIIHTEYDSGWEQVFLTLSLFSLGP